MKSQNKDKKSKLVLWIFVLFFSTFIIVDVIYIIIAQKTWRGLETENGYQKGLNYNQTIKALEKQKKLGWNLQIKYQKISKKLGNLQVILLDKNNHQIRDANLIANFRRPVQEGSDFVSNLKFNSISYESSIEFPFVGQWDVEIIATKKDDVFQYIKRIVIN